MTKESSYKGMKLDVILQQGRGIGEMLCSRGKADWMSPGEVSSRLRKCSRVDPKGWVRGPPKVP